MMEPSIKITMRGSADEVARINACTHEWTWFDEPHYGNGNPHWVLLGRCTKCGTLKGETEK